MHSRLKKTTNKTNKQKKQRGKTTWGENAHLSAPSAAPFSVHIQQPFIKIPCAEWMWDTVELTNQSIFDCILLFIIFRRSVSGVWTRSINQRCQTHTQYTIRQNLIPHGLDEENNVHYSSLRMRISLFFLFWIWPHGPAWSHRRAGSGPRAAGLTTRHRRFLPFHSLLHAFDQVSLLGIFFSPLSFNNSVSFETACGKAAWSFFTHLVPYVANLTHAGSKQKNSTRNWRQMWSISLQIKVFFFLLFSLLNLRFPLLRRIKFNLDC